MELSPHCFPLSSVLLSFRQRLGFRDCIHTASTPMTFWAVSHFGLLDGTPCGAKQAHINLSVVWIFRYSCLWHGDSSWCAWAPQISQCHAWTEAAASGPKRAQPALAGPESPQIPPVTPSTHGGQLYEHPLAACSRSVMTPSVCHCSGDEIVRYDTRMTEMDSCWVIFVFFQIVD